MSCCSCAKAVAQTDRQTTLMLLDDCAEDDNELTARRRMLEYLLYTHHDVGLQLYYTQSV